jgi:tripartite-type tricarboxylate transporter receptor subunit TctC
MHRNLFVPILVATFMGIAPAPAQDNFPTKPIKIVLPVPAGSALDIATRAIADQLTARWGQQVLIEARPGAGGLIAGQAVATAPADGYTLVGGPASLFTILPAQKDKLPIDVNRDFAQLGMIVGSGIMFIAVAPKLGVSTFPEFVALAKSKPGQIAVGTNGAGTLPHFSGLVLEKKGGVPITVVPYNQGGTMAAVADIMGGRVHGTIEGVFGLRGPLQSGDLKLIGSDGAGTHARVSRRADGCRNPARTDRHRLHEPRSTRCNTGADLAPPERGASPGARYTERQAALCRPWRTDPQHDAGGDQGVHRERTENLVAAGQRVQLTIAARVIAKADRPSRPGSGFPGCRPRAS